MGKFGDFMRSAGGGLVSGGMSVLGNVLGGIFQNKQNRRSQGFQREMYDKQYADQLQFWRMNNEYNDPSAQMARLKAAGLNPALLYGQSGSGASGVSSSPPKAPVPGTPQFIAPNMSGVSESGARAVDQIYSLDIKKAQLSNMEKQGNVIANEAILKAAQAYDTLESGRTRKFDLGLKRDLRQTSLDSQKELLRRQILETTGVSISNEAKARGEEHRKAMRPGELVEQSKRNAILEIERRYKGKLSQAQLNLLRKQVDEAAQRMKLNKFELRLNEVGLTKSDPRYWRVADQWRESIMKELQNIKAFKPGTKFWQSIKKPYQKDVSGW